MGNISKPSARVSVRRIDRYVDEDAIIVTTTIGDIAGSHGASYDALKKAGIRPTNVYAGSIRLTFNPNEVTEGEAKAIVVAALERGGVKIISW